MSISQALATFLNQNAQPTATSSKITFDNAFVSELLRESTTDNWRKDKIGIFIEVKNYSSRYIIFRNAVKDLQLYQDFYELVLVHLLQCNFNEAIRRVPKRVNASVVRIKEMEDFIKICFSSFVNDSLYYQAQSINDQLEVQETRTKQLREQQIKVSKKIEQASEQQKLAFQKAENDIQEQSQKITETSTAVLGVFVGVVMVFFGGFTILENAISGMGTLSVYRISFTMLLFGLIETPPNFV